MADGSAHSSGAERITWAREHHPLVQLLKSPPEAV